MDLDLVKNNTITTVGKFMTLFGILDAGIDRLSIGVSYDNRVAKLRYEIGSKSLLNSM